MGEGVKWWLPQGPALLNAETFLSDTFPEQKCLELKTSLLAQQRGTQSSLDRLRALLRLIQGEQMLQVTMTTTSPAPLLAGPWTKPSTAAIHSALQHPQGHN